MDGGQSRKKSKGFIDDGPTISDDQCCLICFKNQPKPDVKCQKECKRVVHSGCINPKVQSHQFEHFDKKWQCVLCLKGLSECFYCKEIGPVKQQSEKLIVKMGATKESAK